MDCRFSGYTQRFCIYHTRRRFVDLHGFIRIYQNFKQDVCKSLYPPLSCMMVTSQNCSAQKKNTKRFKINDAKIMESLCINLYKYVLNSLYLKLCKIYYQNFVLNLYLFLGKSLWIDCEEYYYNFWESFHKTISLKTADIHKMFVICIYT